MKSSNLIKTSGYVVSTLSVIMLGIVSAKSAREHPLLLVLLIGGMTTSVIGMALRWLSYQMDRE